ERRWSESFEKHRPLGVSRYQPDCDEASEPSSGRSPQEEVRKDEHSEDCACCHRGVPSLAALSDEGLPGEDNEAPKDGEDDPRLIEPQKGKEVEPVGPSDLAGDYTMTASQCSEDGDGQGAERCPNLIAG